MRPRPSSLALSLLLALALASAAQAGTFPQVAVDADGDASFIWRISDATNTLIQERSETAAAVLSDPQWISAAGQSVIGGSVGVDASGDAFVTWSRYNGSHYIAQARRRAADGSLGPVMTLSTTGQSAFDPEVAVNADGAAVFVWQRFNGTNNVIQARRRTATGSLGGVQTISTAGQHAAQPQVAIDADENATFTWRRFDGTNHIIQARRRAADGTLSPVNDLSAAGRDAHEPDIAVGSNGDAFVTWRRFDGNHHIVQARRRTPDGTLGAILDLSAAGQEADQQHVGVDGTGRTSFTWRRHNGTNRIVQARRRAADGTLGPVVDLSATGANASFPEIAVSQGGIAAFVWQRSNGSNTIIQARTRGSDGTLNPVQDLSAPGKDASFPEAGIDSDGDAVFTWQRLNDAGAQIVQSRRRSAGGTLSPTQDLSE